MKTYEVAYNKIVQCHSHIFMFFYSFKGFVFKHWTEQYFNIVLKDTF